MLWLHDLAATRSCSCTMLQLHDVAAAWCCSCMMLQPHDVAVAWCCRCMMLQMHDVADETLAAWMYFPFFSSSFFFLSFSFFLFPFLAACAGRSCMVADKPCYHTFLMPVTIFWMCHKQNLIDGLPCTNRPRKKSHKQLLFFQEGLSFSYFFVLEKKVEWLKGYFSKQWTIQYH